MILVLVPQQSPRLSFILDLILKEILSYSFKITTSKEEFLEYSGAKISYGAGHYESSLNLSSNHILWEDKVKNQKITVGEYKGIKTFFQVNEGDLPYDPFAAAFYFVTRYEEYLPHVKDKHERFRTEESLLYKTNQIAKPIVNIWALQLGDLLEEKFKIFSIRRSFEFTPILEINNAYIYKHRGRVNAFLSSFSDFLTLKWGKLKKRVMIYSNLKSDPHDGFDNMITTSKRFNVKPVFFYLSDNNSRFDNNISLAHAQSSRLIARFKENGFLGILLSYRSGKSIGDIGKEKKKIEEISHLNVEKCRVSYIRNNFPNYYQNVAEAGFKEDYSMQFSSTIGFRAGICIPFRFFDLTQNKCTDLVIHPIVFSDTILKFKMKISSGEVLSSICPIVEEVAAVGGDFAFVFHNETFGENRYWKNWNDIYEKILKVCLNHQQ